MAKVGAILGLIGSVILLITGLFWISMSRLIYSPSIPFIIPYISGGVTIAISAIGITGTVLAFRDINIAGYILLLVAGILGIIGTFIPIYIYDTGWGYLEFFFLSNTLLYGDLILMLVGGILGFALGGKKERKE